MVFADTAAKPRFNVSMFKINFVLLLNSQLQSLLLSYITG